MQHTLLTCPTVTEWYIWEFERFQICVHQTMQYLSLARCNAKIKYIFIIWQVSLGFSEAFNEASGK